ncbi:MAG: hypothetical protein KIT47_12020 [Rhodoferax sp.]|nr:hypothetical protein [Rhodoferax sp.]
MAALSKFEAPERYNLHLAVWSIVALAALVFGAGAAMRKRWANLPLTLLSVGAAIFWFWASSVSAVNLIIALVFTLMSWYLLYSRYCSRTSQDA